MPDEATPESTSNNFSAMGGSTDAVLAQLDGIERSAGAAANAAASGERQASGTGRSLADTPTDKRLAELDDIMAQTQIAAESQAALEREGYDVEAAEDLEGDEEGDEDEELEAGDAAPEPAQRREGEQSEPRRFTRREAERLASELEQHKQALQTRTAADQRILLHLQEQSGYTVDANGKFKYENLREKVLSGTATRAERDEVAQMTQWHEFAGPIFKAAEDQVAASFSDGYRRSIQSVAKSEQLEPAAVQRLWRSPDPIKEAVLLGRELERKASKAKPAARPATPARPQHRPASTAAHIPPRPRGEPGWMTPILDRLDKEMETSAAAANRQRDREAAELEEQRRRNKRHVA